MDVEYDYAASSLTAAGLSPASSAALWAAHGETKQLAKPPPPKLAEVLRLRGVDDLSVGQVILATDEKYAAVVLETIQELGLELQIIFNKRWAMVLPTGVNKATGLTFALEELRLSPSHVAGVGDAENDHSFLSLCGWSVAVANALPALKNEVDYITTRPDGDGVAELIEMILTTDLPSELLIEPPL